MVRILGALSGIATVGAAFWSTNSGDETYLRAVSSSQLNFNLAGLVVDEADDGSFSLQLPGWSQLEQAGHPDLPVLRASMAVPQHAEIGDVHIKLSNVKVQTVPMAQWGSSVTPSKGKCPICGQCNATAPAASAYRGNFPAGDSVSIVAVRKWRDVTYVSVEVQPVNVNHDAKEVTVLQSASIEMAGVIASTESLAPVSVEVGFSEAYAFFFDNWEHLAHEYVASTQVGRVLVVYDAALKSEAEAYADLIRDRVGPSDIVMYEAEYSSSSIQSKIQTLYQEPEKLAYVTIVGRDVASPTGSQTRTACDNCYVMLSGGTDLDVPIGRISGDSTGVNSYLDKLRKYDASDTSPWTKQAYGTYSMVMQDELRMMTNVMNTLKGGGYTTSFVQDTRTSGSESAEHMNEGLGVFSYIGHGSGTAWNTPRFSVSQVQSLTNYDKPFFELDVSCDNGDFQSHRPCMGEALITSRGGAIATMMSSPTMKGTMCKRYQEQAATAIVQGTASRVGNIYNVGLMKGNAITRDTYAMQAYNVFGDPTQAIVGSKPAPTPTPSPSPSPTPVPPPPSPVPPPPTPTPTPGSCRAISALVDDDWCQANCASGFCPSDLCKCDGIVV